MSQIEAESYGRRLADRIRRQPPLPELLQRRTVSTVLVSASMDRSRWTSNSSRWSVTATSGDESSVLDVTDSPGEESDGLSDDTYVPSKAGSHEPSPPHQLARRSVRLYYKARAREEALARERAAPWNVSALELARESWNTLVRLHREHRKAEARAAAAARRRSRVASASIEVANHESREGGTSRVDATAGKKFVRKARERVPSINRQDCTRGLSSTFPNNNRATGRINGASSFCGASTSRATSSRSAIFERGRTSSTISRSKTESAKGRGGGY
uniref:HMG box domain-containing protein n=1 Tax=Steinernema glaseri TaxID=37863 RepID=A0A1I7YUU0_9BILA